jgi:hypothetical protein
MHVKFLNAGGLSTYQSYRWYLPDSDKPGAWVKAEGPLKHGFNGVHACDVADAIYWMDAQAYEIELRGRIIKGDNKVCAREGRLLRRLPWNEQTRRLFACESAEHVAHLTSDPRCAETIRVARRFAFGAASRKDLTNAEKTAWAATAWAATTTAREGVSRTAAWAATRVAAWAASGAADVVAEAVAAWAAAWEAAREESAAREAAERAWQSNLLTRVLTDDGTWLEEQRAKAEANL